MEQSILVEIEWDFEGDEDNPDWAFCMEQANFVHRDACEFILHIGKDPVNREDEYWHHLVKDMKEAECTPAFIEAYLAAKDAGATRVLFWAG